MSRRQRVRRLMPRRADESDAQIDDEAVYAIARHHVAALRSECAALLERAEDDDRGGGSSEKVASRGGRASLHVPGGG